MYMFYGLMRENKILKDVFSDSLVIDFIVIVEKVILLILGDINLMF